MDFTMDFDSHRNLSSLSSLSGKWSPETGTQVIGPAVASSTGWWFVNKSLGGPLWIVTELGWTWAPGHNDFYHHFTSLLGGFKHEILTFPFSWECHHPNWRTHIFQRVRYTTNQFWYRLPGVFPWETRWIGKTPAFGAKFSRWLWPRLQLSGQAWGFSYTRYKVNSEAINHHEHYYVSTCFNTWWFFESSISMYLYSWWL